ncbi:MAG TPA: hypothetical protein VNM34_15945 [Verrucomicrobiae bacterium]|nr:hypothetical protein [Verrucomicrobiae bacterium]
MIALVALSLGVQIWRSLPHAEAITGSRLVLDLPTTWQTADAGQIYDAAWAAEEKQKYPQDAALIDSLVDALQAGDPTWYARIDVDGDRVAEGWVLASVKDKGGTQADLHATAFASTLFQPVQIRPGTTVVDVTLPTGPAARLDWSYDLRLADGTTEIATVRSYWLIDGTKTVVIQLTFYGDRPAVMSDFDSVVRTLRWAS